MTDQKMVSYRGLPNSPGCYIFRDENKRIIYIGKAKSIRKRVASYFSNKEHDPKTAQLVKNIKTIEHIITDSEVEALILESNLVKKHQPKYNIDLKDSKRYAYIALTGEDFPRVLLARDRAIDAQFFGPFTSAVERDAIIETINQHFQLRTCRKMPKRACTRYYIKLCPAPCIGMISREEYGLNVEKARIILKGNTADLSSKLREEMISFSKIFNYEKALDTRDQLFSLQRLEEQQKMERSKNYDEDIISYLISAGKAYILIFNVYHGTLINKKEFVLDATPGFFQEFIIRYYSEEKIPGEIITSDKVDDAARKFIVAIAKKNIRFIVPKKGEKKELLDLAIKNIEINFFSGTLKLEALKQRLRLEGLPQTIECFDISHLSGTSMTGSMVQFKDGVAYKPSYRRFKLRSISGIDDFAALQEVLERRYSRLIKENSGFPDLIIIDGGKGQLNAALETLKQLNLKVPTISIAKRLEEVYVPGMQFPLQLDRKDKALQLIQEIRDEAHRFAINYNKLLRKKSLLRHKD